jgi:2,3-bisphosphoglycerate-dependent phosphoglycerate mutase
MNIRPTMLYRNNLVPKQNRFLLVRHGESIWNKDSKFTGWTNIPLTKKGKLEAFAMANAMASRKLVPTVLFTSVLDRSVETTNIIKKEFMHLHNIDLPIYTSWRLNERHYGTLEGIPRQYIRDLFGARFTKIIRCNFTMKPPIVRDYEYSNDYPVYRNCYFKSIQYGESKENVLDRVLPYYENDILYTLSEHKFPLIVTHKHTARVLMKHLLRMSDADFEHFELPEKKILLVNLTGEMMYESHEEIAW